LPRATGANKSKELDCCDCLFQQLLAAGVSAAVVMLARRQATGCMARIPQYVCCQQCPPLQSYLIKHYWQAASIIHKKSLKNWYSWPVGLSQIYAGQLYNQQQMKMMEISMYMHVTHMARS